VAQAIARSGSRKLKVPSRSKKKLSQTQTTEDGRTVAELASALTALRAHTTEILQRKKQLNQLNRWFNIALNNMARGLSMFGADQRSIVCNRLYREIYGLPERLTRPGTPLANILRYHRNLCRGSWSAHRIGAHRDLSKMGQAKRLQGISW